MFGKIKSKIIILTVILMIVGVFAWIYNMSVSQALADASSNAKATLQSNNYEVIEKLVEEESVDTWDDIVRQYTDIIVVIEDSDNNEICSSQKYNWSAFDLKFQTPFEFKGDSFLIISSVYLLDDYVTDVRTVVKFFFIELLFVITILVNLILLIYILILRPFNILYRVIEAYDETGELEKANIKGYAGQVYHRFISMAKNLDANQANQRRIIASISHDIKTPLTSIMGYAERLQKDNIPEERKKHYLETVYLKSVEIKELVNEFDEYLSFDHKQKVQLTPCDTKKIAAMIKEDYETDLEDMGIRLEVNDFAGAIPVKVDKQKLKRVFGNIVSNSVKHFKSENKIIRVDITADKEKLHIDIHDNGEGVPSEKLELIFEPLYTSDEGRKVAGLGLSICREIIEAHSGKIYAKSSELGGVAICIELARDDKKHKQLRGQK